MAFDEELQAFKDKLADVHLTLQSELAAIATDAEDRARQIAEDFEADPGLAEGVGAVAGTVIGGALGRPEVCVVGNVIGKPIGGLFTLEVVMRRESFVLDVPQLRKQVLDFSYDVPAVVGDESNLCIDMFTFEMKRQEGPRKPDITLRWMQQCADLGWPIGRVCADVPETVIAWTPTHEYVTVTGTKTQRLPTNSPQVQLTRQELTLDVPEISVQTTEFNAGIPCIALRFVQDAGKRTAAMAAALAQSAQDAAVQRLLAYKHRVRAEVAPHITRMFDRTRDQMMAARASVLVTFSDPVQTLMGAVTIVAAASAAQDEAKVMQARAALDAALAMQAKALAPIDGEWVRLAESLRAAIAQFLGDGKSPERANGGLIKAAFTDGAHGRVPGLVAMSSRGASVGRYLTIGLNRIDPAAYGTPGILRACENDACDMAALAAKAGFTGTTLLNENATSSALLAQLVDAAATLHSGDILMLAYSGHGGKIGDVTGDESDALDETWCLYDRQLIDDELYAMWARFRAGVRIVVFSDSCHSGGVSKALSRTLYARARHLEPSTGREISLYSQEEEDLAGDALDGAIKALPLQQTWDMYLKDKPMYDSLQLVAGVDNQSSAAIKASVLLLSACQDDQLSRDGPRNGAFTLAVKTAWGDGAFQGSYKDFHLALAAHNGLRSDQTPNYAFVGARNIAFEAQRPFTV